MPATGPPPVSSADHRDKNAARLARTRRTGPASSQPHRGRRDEQSFPRKTRPNIESAVRTAPGRNEHRRSQAGEHSDLAELSNSAHVKVTVDKEVRPED